MKPSLIALTTVLEILMVSNTMKRITFLLIAVLILTSVILATGQYPETLSAARSQVDVPSRLTSRERITGLSVRSVPDDAEVYVAAISELELDVKEVEGGDAMVRRFAGVGRFKITNQEEFWEVNKKMAKIISPRFHKGKVPVTLELPPGSYLVFIVPPPSVTDPDAKFEVATVHGPTFTLGQISASGEKVSGVVSLVEVVPGENNLLVQLWHPEKMALSEVEKFYPGKETFPLAELVLTKSLAQQKMKVKEADIPIMLRLLRKGGKVVYRKGSETMVIQVNSSSEESLWIVRYKD